jgi:CrcB protein
VTDPDAAPTVVLPALLVGIGGVIGSLARYGLVQLAPHLLTTLAINVAGSFLLGALVARRSAEHWSRPLLGTGVLGGFTTMSALAVQAVTSTPATAVAYVLASVLLGTAAAVLGLRT